ncbi:unnamed protein product [Trichogramma brassicae]|uniref:Uncharacterized protein n=1 Tax=Trichogramma brassicae TaxID=86971 RepID=A0A6H5IQ42_9HYME|nr:unnamed protein product [Trichogramma brassicae]
MKREHFVIGERLGDPARKYNEAITRSFSCTALHCATTAEASRGSKHRERSPRDHATNNDAIVSFERCMFESSARKRIVRFDVLAQDPSDESMNVDMASDSETITPTSEDAQMKSADAPPATEDKKLALLQWENERLKEFLTERNTELRKQFNMLLALQNEIMKICKDYRIKFTEANYLIKLLSERAQNDERTVDANGENAAAPVQPMSTENMSEIHKVFHTLIENIKIPNDVELLSLMDDKYKEYLEGKYLAEMNVFLKQLAENRCVVCCERERAGAYTSAAAHIHTHTFEIYAEIYRGTPDLYVSYTESFTIRAHPDVRTHSQIGQSIE